MDRTVPLAAARMLDFIRATEVGTDGPSGYNVIYGFNQDKLPKPVTQMTIDEVLGAQASWSKRFGSSATGAYQFMRATLTDLKRELGLRGTQILDPDLQDRLGFHLLKRRGYDAFMSGQIGRTEFGKRLAQEWASFPVLASVRGQHRQLARGQSFYTGDALNKALVLPEEFERVIDAMKEIGDAMPAPAEVAPARPEPGTLTQPPVITGGTAMPGTVPLGSPVEKAIGAGKGAAQGAAAGLTTSASIIILLEQFGALPASADNALVGMAITGVLTGFSAFVLAVVQSYRAPANAPAS